MGFAGVIFSSENLNFQMKFLVVIELNISENSFSEFLYVSVMSFVYSFRVYFLKNSYERTVFLIPDSVCILSIIYYLELQDVDVTQEPLSQNDGHYSWVLLGN